MNRDFYVTIAPCDYSEGIAVYELLADNPAGRERVENALTREPVCFVSQAPPCPLAINMAVVSPAGRFLAVKRSATVATGRSLWSVGPNETMTLTDREEAGTNSEDFFELARRCLREELGLVDGDYGRISLSWFGYCSADCHPWVFGQVRSRLTEARVEEKFSTCFGSEEADRLEWLPLTTAVIRRIAGGKRIGRDAIESDRRRIIHAPLALYELWRMRSTI